MDMTVTIDKARYKIVARKARALGKSPEQYLESLIDAANMTLDEILAPVREDFRRSGMTEDDLDAIVTDARKAIHAKKRRKARG
jgi:hypothetical protein